MSGISWPLQLILDRIFVQFGSAPDEVTGKKAARLLHESRHTFETEDTQTAVEMANEACRIIPDMADGFAQRARMLYKIGNPDEALADARHALDIDPTLDEMLIFGAGSACDLQKWQEAASLGRLALERNRTQGNAHFLVGQALNELDQVDAALAHFKLARSYGFKLPSLYNNAGWTCRRSGRPLEGLEWYQQGLEIEPDGAYLLANSTAAAMEADEPLQAYHYLELLRQMHPTFPDIQFLAKTLAAWCQEEEGGPTPVLSNRIIQRNTVGVVECTNCDALISIEDEKQMLCGGCGALLPPSIEPCSCCGSKGKVILRLVDSLCPFCADGTLKYTPRDE